MKQLPPPSTPPDSRAPAGVGSSTSFESRREPLGKMLRSLLVRTASIMHPEVLKDIENHGHLSTNAGFIEERPFSTASLSHAVGAGAVEIGLLYDLNLSRELAAHHQDPADRECASRLLAEARMLRRNFNRLGKDSTDALSTRSIAQIVSTVEQRVLEIEMPGERKQILSRAFDECAHHLQLAGRVLPWEVARESVAYILGELREVAVGKQLNCSDVPPPELPTAALTHLRSYIEHLQRHATECARAVPVSGRDREAGRNLTRAVENLSFRGRQEIEASYSKTGRRSVPVKLVAASRRSLCGTRLGMVHALSELARLYQETPSKAYLERVVDMLKSWKAGELPNELVSGYRGHEALTRHPFSVAGTSDQAFFRDTVLPVLTWSAARFDELPADVRNHHLTLLVRSSVEALHALTVRDMATTLDAIRYERDTWRCDARAKWQVPRAFPGARIAQALLGRPLNSSADDSPLIDRHYAPRGLKGRTINTISHHFQTMPSEVTPTDLRFIAETSAWARWCATRYQKYTPKLPTTDALWATEYDGGAGATLPLSVQSEFERMQEEVRIPRGSRRSGLIVPENAEWLRKHIYEHDGFLITMNEGNVLDPTAIQKPSALFLATCSQSKPSPLMEEVTERAASYIEDLPSPSVGTNPHVLCELAISSDDARFYRREYGEHAYQVLWEQAVFNLVARFPTAERIECFATCLDGTDAMKAHSRFGWKETGAIYQDQFGNTANIIHTTVHAAAIVLGYRDITS